MFVIWCSLAFALLCLRLGLLYACLAGLVYIALRLRWFIVTGFLFGRYFVGLRLCTWCLIGCFLVYFWLAACLFWLFAFRVRCYFSWLPILVLECLAWFCLSCFDLRLFRWVCCVLNLLWFGFRFEGFVSFALFFAVCLGCSLLWFWVWIMQLYGCSRTVVWVLLWVALGCFLVDFVCFALTWFVCWCFDWIFTGLRWVVSAFDFGFVFLELRYTSLC